MNHKYKSGAIFKVSDPLFLVEKDYTIKFLHYMKSDTGKYTGQFSPEGNNFTQTHNQKISWLEHYYELQN